MILRCLRFEKRRASRKRLSIRVFNTTSDVSSLVVDVGVWTDENDARDLAVFIATSISPNLPWKTWL
jgi:hypothetical protein